LLPILKRLILSNCSSQFSGDKLKAKMKSCTNSTRNIRGTAYLNIVRKKLTSNLISSIISGIRYGIKNALSANVRWT